MDAVKHQRRSDRAFPNGVLHGAILSIETAHESDLDEASSKGGFRIEDRRAIGFGRRHWLLAEDRFARPDRRDYVSGVRVAPRCDDDRIDLLRRDKLFASGISLSLRNPGRNLIRPSRVGVADRDNPGACKRLGQPANVLLPNLSSSDDPDVQCHE